VILIRGFPGVGSRENHKILTKTLVVAYREKMTLPRLPGNDALGGNAHQFGRIERKAGTY